jgi:hypothetical protein
MIREVTISSVPFIDMKPSFIGFRFFDFFKNCRKQFCLLWLPRAVDLRYPAHRYHAVPSPGFEPMTLWLRVRHPNHSATTLHWFRCKLVKNYNYRCENSQQNVQCTTLNTTLVLIIGFIHTCSLHTATFRMDYIWWLERGFNLASPRWFK